MNARSMRNGATPIDEQQEQAEMEWATPTLAATATLEWLKNHTRWPHSAATPVEALANLLSLDIASFDPALHPGVWGYLEPGENLIFIRAGLAPAVRRFTLAHEMGHALLHRRGGADLILRSAQPSLWSSAETWATCASADVEQFDFGADEALQPGQIYDARSAVEREANAFAVALLMPQEPFLSAYLELCKRESFSNGATTRYLARRFGVSEDAALRRLQSLLTPDEPAASAEVEPSHRYNIDDDQRVAAQLEAPALVIAGPGTGKTSTLVSRVTYLTRERGVAPEQVLMLTFSRKAAGELSARAQRLLAAQGEHALPYISTIHHFCLDLLGRYGSLVGISGEARVAPEIERYLALRDVMREAPLARLAPAYAPDMYVRDALQAISKAKDDLLAPEDAARRADSAGAADSDAAARQTEFALLYQHYQRQQTAQGVLDFGDVIALTVQLLQNHREVAAEVAAQWPHMLVDEYQDINRAMDTLIQALASAGAQLWAVGDADQAIYRFRGADPGIVYRFQETYPDAHVVSLARNYRSRRSILQAAGAFASQFSLLESRRALTPVRTDVTEEAACVPAVRLALATTDGDELAGLAAAMQERQLRGTPYGAQVALLRTRRQVERVALGLRERGIPTTMLSNAFDDETVKHLLALVSVLSEPAGLGLIRVARQAEHAFSREDAVTLIREARARRRPVYALLTHPRHEGFTKISREGRAAMRRLGRMLQRMQAGAGVASGLALYCFTFTQIGAQALVSGTEQTEPTTGAAALRRLLDLARAYDDWQAKLNLGATAAPNWAGFADYVQAAATLRLDGLDSLGQDADSAVRVMTVHASKGLEFPVVYTPQLVNRRFPLTGGGQVGTLWDRVDDAPERGELSEEAALFYVAMTRAQNELILSYARKYGKASYTPSPFLAPIEAALGETLPRDEWRAQEKPASSSTASDQEAESVDDAAVSPTAEAQTFELNELETYQRCPKQYSYRYVDALSTPPTLTTLYNAVLRQVTGEITAAFAGKRELNQAEALALFEERWRAALRKDGASAEESGALVDGALSSFYLRQGRQAVARLWQRLSRDPEGIASGVQVTPPTRAQSLTVQVGEVAIRGDVEVIEPTGGEVERALVVRYKSASAGPTLRDLFIAAAAEATGAASEPGKALLANSTTGERSLMNLSSRQRARLEREAASAASGIRRRDFHAAPDERTCQRCPFASSCPE